MSSMIRSLRRQAKTAEVRRHYGEGRKMDRDYRVENNIAPAKGAYVRDSVISKGR